MIALKSLSIDDLISCINEAQWRIVKSGCYNDYGEKKVGEAATSLIGYLGHVYKKGKEDA